MLAGPELGSSLMGLTILRQLVGVEQGLPQVVEELVEGQVSLPIFGSNVLIMSWPISSLDGPPLLLLLALVEVWVRRRQLAVLLVELGAVVVVGQALLVQGDQAVKVASQLALEGRWPVVAAVVAGPLAG